MDNLTYRHGMQQQVAVAHHDARVLCANARAGQVCASLDAHGDTRNELHLPLQDMAP